VNLESDWWLPIKWVATWLPEALNQNIGLGFSFFQAFGAGYAD
jgi:hypothetical protein